MEFRNFTVLNFPLGSYSRELRYCFYSLLYSLLRVTLYGKFACGNNDERALFEPQSGEFAKHWLKLVKQKRNIRLLAFWYFSAMRKVHQDKRKLSFNFSFLSPTGNFFRKSSTKLVPDVSLLKSLISTKAAELVCYAYSNRSSLAIVSISDFTQLHIWHIMANKFALFSKKYIYNISYVRLILSFCKIRLQFFRQKFPSNLTNPIQNIIDSFFK